MEDETDERKPKRQKRESSYKAKAFEKFKQLKNGLRNKYEVEEIENVYDIVDEKEYTENVLKRQDDDWIVDDDGSGYVEDGRDVFDDDLDKESIAAATSSSKGKGVKRKKKSVAENAGKGNLQFMLSNMPTKKKEEKKLDDDQTLSELLGEIDDSPATVVLKPKPVTSNLSPLSTKLAEKEYMKSLSSTSAKKTPVSKIQKTVHSKPQKPPSPPPTEILKETNKPEVTETVSETDDFLNNDFFNQIQGTTETTVEENVAEQSQMEEETLAELFEADIDMSQIEKVEETKEEEDKNTRWDNIETEMMKDWGSSNEIESLENVSALQGSDVPLIEVEGKKVFRFFWWDAYEDIVRQPGVVLLFGKTYHEKIKSYVSCCVVVRNIERKVFFLPRTTEKNSNSPVTSQDVYKEINESIMKAMKVQQFKARPVTKKYAFDPQIPAESDYIEVRYSAKEPQLAKTIEGNTFSKVFGTESSFLEILLLDRKIKGPCWLEINNPTPVANPVTWCKLEIDCNKISDVSVSKEKKERPPLVVSSINLRRVVNPKTHSNQIVMISFVTNVSYSVDKQAPDVLFQNHFCLFTSPDEQILPLDMFSAMKNYNITNLTKMNTEKALLNCFINKFSLLDSDLIVGHDLQGYQINILCERLAHHHIANFSKLGRIKKSVLLKPKLERELFVGRLVCDVKISAKELIRCRSYDLDALCQSVLKLNNDQRIDLEPEDVPKMFQTSSDVLKLVSLTMQDTSYILKIMYNLNIIPLALQITNIAGNTMSKTLMGGRSERNEFLLLHAFSEKDYIVPDKSFGKKAEKSTSARKKPAYSGGLVLDPKVGFYDKLILLMDFNSLYPSIIQEYNICFTTMPPDVSEDKMVLPDKNLPLGILPTEVRKLVESRREVKKLMNNPDISTDLRMQYHIRQMALKLTANSMYGCLGFSNSRFYAKNLAALVTYKGREILTNTKDLVEKMNYEVIYGDTDSLMINTNITDYEQVFQIGSKIKQEINKLYRQVELDIDGVFQFLLLLKKKKYAAVTLSKGKNGDLKSEVEYKGLDIVRRDWSRLASEAGKYVLNQILSGQSSDDRFNNILSHLRKLREDLEAGKVPLSLLVITKQLTKNPNQYPDGNVQPHVQVALRYNRLSGGHFRAGDTVPYLICDDGTSKSATQRAYHIEELKNSSTLKIDVKYYLAQQIHPVVSRICEPIEELDPFQIADCLGVDHPNLAKRQNQDVAAGENVTKPEFVFRNVDKFVFKCYSCKLENEVEGPIMNNVPVLEKCQNLKCDVRPVDYVGYIQNQMIRAINSYVNKYYMYTMYCEDPTCIIETNRLPMSFAGRFPVCISCTNAVMLKKYTELHLYTQIRYFQYIFDLDKVSKRPLLENQVEKAYNDVKETVEKQLEYCGYSLVKLGKMFDTFSEKKEKKILILTDFLNVDEDFEEDE